MFEPEPITRDARGLYLHSALQGQSEESYIDLAPAAVGMEFKYVNCELDAPEIYQSYIDSDDPSLAAWNPTPPEGAGWFLAGIYENESGSFAAFARPKDQA
jgi:hypothetical protein